MPVFTNYFHKAVGEYLKMYNECGKLDPHLQDLADKIIIEVESTYIPKDNVEEKLQKLKIKRRRPEHEDFNLDLTANTSMEGKGSKTKWTLAEVETLKTNWTKFSQKYEIDNPFLFTTLCKRKTKLKPKVMQRFQEYLMYGIEHRNKKAVFRKWRDLVCTPKTGKLTDAELSVAKIIISRCSVDDSYNILAIALQRKISFMKRKIDNLINYSISDSSQNKKKWTLETEEKLMNTLVDRLAARTLEELNERIPLCNWHEIKLALGMTNKQVYNRWHYHLQPALMMQKWHDRSTLHVKIIKRLRKFVNDSDVEEIDDIDWTDLGKCLGGFSSLYIVRQFYTLRWRTLGSTETKVSFSETVEKIWTSLIPQIKMFEKIEGKKFLRRLSYNWTTHTLSVLQPPDLGDESN